MCIHKTFSLLFNALYAGACPMHTKYSVPCLTNNHFWYFQSTTDSDHLDQVEFHLESFFFLRFLRRHCYCAEKMATLLLGHFGCVLIFWRVGLNGQTVERKKISIESGTQNQGKNTNNLCWTKVCFFPSPTFFVCSSSSLQLRLLLLCSSSGTVRTHTFKCYAHRQQISIRPSDSGNFVRASVVHPTSRIHTHTHRPKRFTIFLARNEFRQVFYSLKLFNYLKRRCVRRAPTVRMQCLPLAPNTHTHTNWSSHFIVEAGTCVVAALLSFAITLAERISKMAVSEKVMKFVMQTPNTLWICWLELSKKPNREKYLLSSGGVHSIHISLGRNHQSRTGNANKSNYTYWNLDNFRVRNWKMRARANNERLEYLY